MTVPTLLPWQEPQWRQVAASRAAGRLAHAILLSGPRGVGKRQFAQRLAASLLCESAGAEVCGHCRGCQQFIARSHPNLFLLQPEEDKRDISVDAIRELGERLALTAHYGGAKVAVIEPADALNVSGVNALLKTIEEPPANSYLLLLTDRPMLLAPTLRSRCQFLRFGIPPRQQALAWLQSQEPKATEATLDAAHGAPLRALELLTDGEIARQEQWRRSMSAIATGQESPLGLASGIDKTGAIRFAEWLLTWMTAQQRALAAPSRSKAATSEPGAVLGIAGVDALSQECLAAIRRLHANAPPQLTMESLIIGFWQRCRFPSKEMRA